MYRNKKLAYVSHLLRINGRSRYQEKDYNGMLTLARYYFNRYDTRPMPYRTLVGGRFIILKDLEKEMKQLRS